MKKFSVVLLLLILAGFGYGLNRLFSLRFESGDIYPAYSSFRTDPLGTRALYESFDRVARVERNFKPLLRMESGRGTALLVLGVQPNQLRVADVEMKDLDQYVGSCGRLVISFYPIFSAREIAAPAPVSPTGAKAKARNQRKNSQDTEEAEPGISLSKQWKFDVAVAALERNKANAFLPAIATKESDDQLPDEVSCHSALFFDKLDPAWRVVYARTNDQAVLVERRLGSGSIVLAADSYWFSNEALLNDRQPQLLAWFTGPTHTAIFDETHLGVQEHRGVATLARKYRLHGLVAGLLLLTALFVWRYGFSLVPPYEEELRREQGEFVSGKESAAGFANLLRRNISSRELLKICLEEWNKSCRHGVPLPRLQRIQSVIDAQNALPERERDPIATYRQISEALSRSARR